MPMLVKIHHRLFPLGLKLTYAFARHTVIALLAIVLFMQVVENTTHQLID